MKELGFVHFHNPVFFANTNIGNKVDPYNHPKIPLKIYKGQDPHTGEPAIQLIMGKFEDYVPLTNVGSYSYLRDQVVAAPVIDAPKAKPGPKPRAQVSGPHDHVFAQGPGKTRD